MSGVPVHEATTHVVSLLFSSSYEGLLEMLCSTGTSPGICMLSFGTGHIVSSRFQVRHCSDAVVKLLRHHVTTQLLVFLCILNRSQHLLILSLYMVFTHDIGVTQ